MKIVTKHIFLHIARYCDFHCALLCYKIYIYIFFFSVFIVIYSLLQLLCFNFSCYLSNWCLLLLCIFRILNYWLSAWTLYNTTESTKMGERNEMKLHILYILFNKSRFSLPFLYIRYYTMKIVSKCFFFVVVLVWC